MSKRTAPDRNGIAVADLPAGNRHRHRAAVSRANEREQTFALGPIGESRRGAAELFGCGVPRGCGVLCRAGVLAGDGAACATATAFGGSDARGDVRATGGGPATPQQARLIVAAASAAAESFATGMRATGWFPD